MSKNTLSFPKKKDKAIAKHHPHLNCHFPCESQTKDEIRRSLAVKMLHDEDEKKNMIKSTEENRVRYKQAGGLLSKEPACPMSIQARDRVAPGK